MSSKSIVLSEGSDNQETANLAVSYIVFIPKEACGNNVEASVKQKALVPTRDLRITREEDVWVAQWVKLPTLDFSSAHDLLWGGEMEPALGSTLNMESA